MKILFILDPLENLTLHNDTSLELIRVFTRRGHTCFLGLIPDLFVQNEEVFSGSQIISPKKNSLKFTIQKKSKRKLGFFDAVLIRKEPPFNMNYIHMTYILDLASNKTLLLNNPTGIRSTNEKFASLAFPEMVPPTLISGSSQEIILFQKKQNADLILKPLDECAGRGITLLPKKLSQPKKIKMILSLTKETQTPIVAQYFISHPSLRSDKRVFLLDGKVIAAYERQFAEGNFRGNLHQGSKHKETILTSRERKDSAQIGTWAVKRGLHFVGLDFFDNRLLEINVTCPGGLVEAAQLYPGKKLFEQLAQSIEKRAIRFRG